MEASAAAVRGVAWRALAVCCGIIADADAWARRQLSARAALCRGESRRLRALKRRARVEAASAESAAIRLSLEEEALDEEVRAAVEEALEDAVEAAEAEAEAAADAADAAAGSKDKKGKAKSKGKAKTKGKDKKGGKGKDKKGGKGGASAPRDLEAARAEWGLQQQARDAEDEATAT